MKTLTTILIGIVLFLACSDNIISPVEPSSKTVTTEYKRLPTVETITDVQIKSDFNGSQLIIRTDTRTITIKSKYETSSRYIPKEEVNPFLSLKGNEITVEEN